MQLDPSRSDCSGAALVELKVIEAIERVGISQNGLKLSRVGPASASVARTVAQGKGGQETSRPSRIALIPRGDRALTLALPGEDTTDTPGVQRAASRQNSRGIEWLPEPRFIGSFQFRRRVWSPPLFNGR